MGKTLILAIVNDGGSLQAHRWKILKRGGRKYIVYNESDEHVTAIPLAEHKIKHLPPRAGSKFTYAAPLDLAHAIKFSKNGDKKRKRARNGVKVGA